MTRGASTSTQARVQPRGLHPAPAFPFAIHPPRGPRPGMDEEAAAFSGSEAVMSRSAGRRVDAVAAASARMRGTPIHEETRVLIDAEELDALGEGDSDGVSFEDALAAAQNAHDKPLAFDVEEQFRVEFEKLVQSEVIKRLESMQIVQPASAPAVGGTSAPSLVPEPFLAAMTVTPNDIDRLWDWLRREAGQTFFGRTPTTALQLYNIIDAINSGEQSGVGLIRAVILEHGKSKVHVGFIMIAPIMTDEKLALVHAYLQPEMRGRLNAFIGPMLDLAAAELPGFKLAVVPTNKIQARLYQPLLLDAGFAAHTIFVR